MDGRFVAYYRVSTDHQGIDGNGILAQRKAVEDYLNGGKWKLVAEFTEVEVRQAQRSTRARKGTCGLQETQGEAYYRQARSAVPQCSFHQRVDGAEDRLCCLRHAERQCLHDQHLCRSRAGRAPDDF